jgi:hypothetical protein
MPIYTPLLPCASPVRHTSATIFCAASGPGVLIRGLQGQGTGRKMRDSASGDARAARKGRPWRMPRDCCPRARRAARVASCVCVRAHAAPRFSPLHHSRRQQRSSPLALAMSMSPEPRASGAGVAQAASATAHLDSVAEQANRTIDTEVQALIDAFKSIVALAAVSRVRPARDCPAHLAVARRCATRMRTLLRRGHLRLRHGRTSW